MSEGAGRWFVVNTRDAQWRGVNDRTAICSFEGEDRFERLGFNVNAIEPGRRAERGAESGRSRCYSGLP